MFSNFMGQLAVGINILITLYFPLKLAGCTLFYTLFQLFFFCYCQCCYSDRLATNELFNPQLFTSNIFQLKPCLQLSLPFLHDCSLSGQVCHIGKSRYVRSKTWKWNHESWTGSNRIFKIILQNLQSLCPQNALGPSQVMKRQAQP